MPERLYIINGKEDKDLTSVGLWFVLTYLYSCNFDSNEQRFLKVSTYNSRIKRIQGCSQKQVKAWVEYAITNLAKNTPNVGGVSLNEQISFAKKLINLSNLKY